MLLAVAELLVLVVALKTKAVNTDNCFTVKIKQIKPSDMVAFLPRCMECRRGLAMRFLSVRLSVRPSVKRVYCDKTEEKSVQIFTALHGMQRGLTMRFLSVRPSVRPSVCPSVKRVHCDKTEESYV